MDIDRALGHATYDQKKKISHDAVVWLVRRGVRVRNAVIDTPAKWEIVQAHPDLFESIEAHFALPLEIKQGSLIARQITKWKHWNDPGRGQD